jgi:hypothetical protein
MLTGSKSLPDPPSLECRDIIPSGLVAKEQQHSKLNLALNNVGDLRGRCAVSPLHGQVTT